ncbi:MAG: hypothetical protein ACFE94_03340 [Candidatus Hodarchaeota archaeon]
MRNRKHISIALILFIVFSTFFSVALFSFSEAPISDIDNEKRSFKPKLADGPPLPYYAINRSAESIYRLFESVNFTIDTFGYSDVDHADMRIDFSNGSTIDYNMQNVAPNRYSYEYKPRYDAHLGLQNVSFLIYNITNTLLNAHTTYTNFTIKTNYLATNINSEYYIGDELNPNFLITNCSKWNLTIVDSTVESVQRNITNFEYNSFQFTYRINNETFYNFLDQTFFIKLNMTNTDFGIKGAAYFPFKVLNTNPIINIASITFTPEEPYRDEDCEITLNVTDLEDLSENLKVIVSIEDPNGLLLKTIVLSHDANITFSGDFSVPTERPVGRYKADIRAEDLVDGTESITVYFMVKNNLPEIHSYKINGRSGDQGLSILYGKNLIFSFNVSDVEGVAYVKVALLDENYEWYNITRDYIGIDTEITIRTIDLITGVWYVYIYVIDSDGVIISLIDDYDKAPQAITIIPDRLSDYLPWIIFFLGLILGILISVGLVYRHFKSKMIDSKAVLPKKKEISPKKPSEKKKVEQVKEIVEEKDTIEKTPEQKEERVPKRRIKRRL